MDESRSPVAPDADSEVDDLIDKSNHLIAELQQLVDDTRKMRQRVDKTLAQSRRLRKRFRRAA